MTEPRLHERQDAAEASSTNDYTPKKYSTGENARITLKIFLIIGLLFGFLWIVNLVKLQ
jgi:hypothetical protein